ncbi:hypothetical protein L873DRAFT_1812881 [Choiromyces venosus 120613-1]|uniref:Uncharacterized protein n=1 Tax=Choiromyces venosus 120613-1 TaxID=1336337 RepID=A0A3N4JEH7_9PEZI|nr:hypothetical protein L873DRAFT_1812881 [Choiromyces venosus 120613-1]
MSVGGVFSVGIVRASWLYILLWIGKFDIFQTERWEKFIKLGARSKRGKCSIESAE